MLIQILTALSVLIGGVYAWLTYQILKTNRATVKAMEEQGAALTRPYIAISAAAEKGSIVFVLTVENLGRTAAERVSLTMDQPFYQFGHSDKNIANMNAFTGFIASFPPGFALNFHLGTSIQIYGGERLDAPIPQMFSITATYFSADGREFVETTTVDLRALYGTAVLKDRGVEELKEIVTALKRLAK